MPTINDIQQQQNLLATYRRTLSIQLQQRAALGAAYTPPGIINGIIEARENIRSIKGVLRGWSASVDDDPLDEELPVLSASATLAPPTSQGSPTINLYGPITTGSTQIGGASHIAEAKITTGDSYDFSRAQISGSNINIGSILTNVTENIGSISNANAAEKQKLAELVKQLNALIQQVPAEQGEDARKVANRTRAIVEEMKQDQPDKELVTFNLESLKKAATTIATVLPAVLPIIDQIVQHIQALIT
jgi:hypothetical protein